MVHFVGRKQELEDLKSLHNRRGPGLVVIRGRRRIGKSRLVTEFASLHPQNRFWNFAGLAPEKGTTAQSQRDHFAQRLASILKIPRMTFDNWTAAFEYLSVHIKSGDIILFDEISWMGSEDSLFIAKLKTWWDNQTIPAMLALCGSVSTWIEKNILKSTALFGRINLVITLEPLSIPESADLLKKIGIKSSSYDTYKILSILGGIPWYLEQLDPTVTVDENIRKLALKQDGLLVSEFDRIFHDLFNGSGSTYKKILEALKDGTKTLPEIRKSIDFAHGGTLTNLMEHLIVAGFVKKQSLWSFKTTKSLRQSLYRISDPYLRFYLKMIEPNLSRIASGGFTQVSLSALPGFDTHIGLQLEYLLLQNHSLLLKEMRIHPMDIVNEGPYRQSKTSTQKGCQVDYLVQTVTKTIFVCEFKCKRQEVGAEILEEMKTKLAALKVPKGFATVPVLFHLAGVADIVDTSLFFYRVVNIADFLEAPY